LSHAEPRLRGSVHYPANPNHFPGRGYPLRPVKAIAKTRPEPGVEIVQVEEPRVGRGQVKIRLEAASVCGTDLHIYAWDGWSSSRIKPPLIIGHEFCGTIVELGEDVSERSVGDFVASESHIVCGHCKQCLAGQAHVCVNTVILGVDVDGGFAEYAVIPWQNARPTSRSIPKEVAAFQDALGNAVHTAMAGPLEGRTVLITGMGPIGLFAIGVCKAAGAAKVIATEVSPFRIELAHKMGVDVVLSPKDGPLCQRILEAANGPVDVTLEMSGHPSSLQLAVDCTRPGGRISLLGLYGDCMQQVDMNALIFKGIEMQGIVGRKLWETWDQMGELLSSGKLDLSPVITHVMHYTEFQKAMELMKAGQAGKVVFTFE
jgi:threonine 3-dehydrogenase